MESFKAEEEEERVQITTSDIVETWKQINPESLPQDAKTLSKESLLEELDKQLERAAGNRFDYNSEPKDVALVQDYEENKKRVETNYAYLIHIVDELADSGDKEIIRWVLKNVPEVPYYGGNYDIIKLKDSVLKNKDGLAASRILELKDGSFDDDLFQVVINDTSLKVGHPFYVHLSSILRHHEFHNHTYTKGDLEEIRRLIRIMNKSLGVDASTTSYSDVRI